MLAGLKVPPVAFECIFYRSEHNTKRGSKELNFEGIERQK